MARIRTIKPEFWKHEDLSALPEATHMLAAALLNYADDEGYFNANPRLVQAECCPLREPSVSVHDSLKQLSDIGYIKLGTGSDGKLYGRIVAFSDHQRINRPTSSKIKDLDIAWPDELSAHEVLTEDSLNTHLRKGKERKGKEQGTGNREQGKDGGACAPADYAFAGRVIRLTAADLDRWRKSYAAVPDLLAELEAADAYYAEHPPPNGKWFFPVSQWLKRSHDRALDLRRQERVAEEKIYAGVL